MANQDILNLPVAIALDGSEYVPLVQGLGADAVTRRATATLIADTASVGGAGGITIGSTAVTNGTSTSVLFNNVGVAGEYAISGSGLFSLTGIAAAENAGPAVVLSFVVAAVGCAFAGMCYSELASMIPVAGSAYTYAYATMGEFIAWIIGWDLVLEYAVAAAVVAVSWSRYVG